jgi:hypothetical protein
MSTFDSSVFTPDSFKPGIGVLDPPNRPDQLADAVLASLSRPSWGYKGRPWGLLKTIVLAAISLGLFPLLCWPKKLRNLMIAEQQQFWHLAEWLRLRTGKPAATALRDDAVRLTPGPSTFVGMFWPAVAIIIFLKLTHDPFFYFANLWREAWGIRPLYSPHIAHGEFGSFWAAWSVVLAAGYFIHWLTVCQRAGAITQYVQRFNAITAEEGIEPVHVRPVGVGFNPFWLAAALIGLWHGFFWAVPMCLAGVVHARYVRATSRQTRGELARRVRLMLQNSRPPLNIRATPAVPGQPCNNQKCNSPLRPGATFCPRCGTRT